MSYIPLFNKSNNSSSSPDAVQDVEVYNDPHIPTTVPLLYQAIIVIWFLSSFVPGSLNDYNNTVNGHFASL
ncbi:hypothetical protein RclHR1_12050001 [Rhizophagus clarus]|uniref:Uncharacterized protein n=1 Tax=Rhizophagus clarus TaxID=94130 RepID=A0A2Z6QZ09_9GLOM|nr:hypothetical protein RclHR1_12050001 [Rhizophagus clarus]